MSVLPVLAGRGTILLDRQAHKTIYDACVYARGLGATVQRFHDLGELEAAAEGRAGAACGWSPRTA